MDNTALQPTLNTRLPNGEALAHGYVPRALREAAVEAHKEEFRRAWQEALDASPDPGDGWRARLQKLACEYQARHTAADAAAVAAGWEAAAPHFGRAAAHREMIRVLVDVRGAAAIAANLGLRVPTLPLPAGPKPPAA